jgi:hypothetical protein
MLLLWFARLSEQELNRVEMISGRTVREGGAWLIYRNTTTTMWGFFKESRWG